MRAVLLLVFPLVTVAAPAQLSRAPATEVAVFAGGCFWGVDAVFKHVRGVVRVVSGYSGGSGATAHYGLVSSHTTGHAESVEVTFDPAQVSYGDLLRVFFTVAHDPTELNRQGPDEGSRSEEHTSELQSRLHLVCRLLLEKKKTRRSILRRPQRTLLDESRAVLR